MKHAYRTRALTATALRTAPISKSTDSLKNTRSNSSFRSKQRYIFGKGGVKGKSRAQSYTSVYCPELLDNGRPIQGL